MNRVRQMFENKFQLLFSRENHVFKEFSTHIFYIHTQNVRLFNLIAMQLLYLN